MSRETRYKAYIEPINPDEKPFIGQVNCMCFWDDGKVEQVQINGQRYSDDMYRITPLQYIGFKDQNDTEIYESDIVRTLDGNFEMKYNGSEAKFDLCRDGVFYPYFSKKYMIKIIGNSYENKELLEK